VQSKGTSLSDWVDHVTDGGEMVMAGQKRNEEQEREKKAKKL
jgi:hypothetical protein